MSNPLGISGEHVCFPAFYVNFGDERKTTDGMRRIEFVDPDAFHIAFDGFSFADLFRAEPPVAFSCVHDAHALRSGSQGGGDRYHRTVFGVGDQELEIGRLRLECDDQSVGTLGGKPERACPDIGACVDDQRAPPDGPPRGKEPLEIIEARQLRQIVGAIDEYLADDRRIRRSGRR